MTSLHDNNVNKVQFTGKKNKQSGTFRHPQTTSKMSKKGMKSPMSRPTCKSFKTKV